jgi:hypothetical protein
VLLFCILKFKPHTHLPTQPHNSLAAFTCGYAVTTPAVCSGYGLGAFREDLARAARRAGVKGEGVVFLLTDGQVCCCVTRGWGG